MNIHQYKERRLLMFIRIFRLWRWKLILN